MDNPMPLQAKLAELKKTYAQQLPKKLAQVEQIYHSVKSNWDVKQLDLMHSLVHGLTGSGATFGFANISNQARCLEHILSDIIEEKTEPSTEQKQQIENALNALKNISQSPIQTAIDQRPYIDLEQINPYRSSGNRLIYLIESNRALGTDLIQQLSLYGYKVWPFANPPEIREAMEHSFPAAVMMNLELLDNNMAEMLQQLQRRYKLKLPLVFTSVNEDLPSRLRAVRAGGKAFLSIPVDVNVLVDQLDTLISNQVSEAYRILIVEDDPALGDHYSLTLQQAGMSTAVVHEPMQLMSSIAEFHPDLILMDLYMPGCDGMDLAAVIRQQEQYISLPIVFLSAETRLDKQLAAMTLGGGDDFLTKPISSSHLISSISARAQRSRILHSFMVRDSLTGLLNHTRIKEQLLIELSRAKRQKSSLIFAMIDIDHFKVVNDSYGHLMGDRVIKSLSRLLRQRLRKTDVIGRYGGEEFAVILTNIQAADALQVMDKIREGFAGIHHQATNQDFSVTFSCGMAAYPAWDAARLNDAADKALYQAKEAGRNRIVLNQAD